MILGKMFDAGFVLDALEERAFPPDHPTGRNPLSWSGKFSELPPVLDRARTSWVMANKFALFPVDSL
jgi:hypothetical protein